MFFPVKVYDGKGNLKRTIKVKSLVTRHWKQFDDKVKGVIDYSRDNKEDIPREIENYADTD